MKICLPVLLLALSVAVNARAQTEAPDSARYLGEFSILLDANVSGSTNGAVRPMWSYSQSWGRYSQYQGWESSLYSKAAYHWHNQGNWFSINAGIAGQVSSDRRRSMLHEAYVSGKIWEIDYTLGREAYTPLDQRDGLGLGTYLMSDNARPTTRFGIGFFDYWAIPGINDWIELKGAFFLGRMPNEDNPSYTKDALLHEKLAYVRLGRFPVKPYLGFVHSVMMGGTLSNGNTLPVDFWASFWGKGSKKMLEAGHLGEYYNAAGGHHGIWDLGIDADTESLGASIYYQRPIYDNTAINLFDFAKCRDFTIGTSLRFKNFKPVKAVCIEWLQTMWQGGNGPADPIFISTGPEKTGEVVGLAVNQVTPEEIGKYVSEDWIREWEQKHGALTKENCMDLMTDYVFKDMPGWTWGNRSPYLQNSYYPQGWTVDGLAMGYPVFLTSTTMSAVAPGYEFASRFSNLRMRAVTAGISGEILPALDYKLKFSFTDNYGCYNDQYYGGINFDRKKSNYYFETNKQQCYTGLWLNYRYKHLNFNAALSYDFGEIYDSFSCRLGVVLTLGPRGLAH